MGSFHYSRYEYSSGYGGARDRVTWAVQRIIVGTAVVFAVQLLLSVPLGLVPPGGRVAEWLAFRPESFLRGFLWQPFTYLFLHGSLLHLFTNMLWLYFFGPEVERLLSTRQFYRFYLFCGAVGVLASFIPYALMATGSVAYRTSPILGASGAVMGVLVAFAVANPERELFLFPIPVPINARGLIFFIVVLNLIGAWGDSNVSVITHFGGMAAGYAYMKLLPRLQHVQWTSGRAAARRPKSPEEAIGEAVDNIFKFERKDRRRP